MLGLDFLFHFFSVDTRKLRAVFKLSLLLACLHEAIYRMLLLPAVHLSVLAFGEPSELFISEGFEMETVQQ